MPQQKSLDESWFWDSEKTPSSDSSKDNDARTNQFPETAGNLSKHDGNKQEQERKIETLRRSIDEKTSRIGELENENGELKETVESLRNENNEINLQIELLDQQHSEAIERMLAVKNDLQAECSRLQNDFEIFRKENDLKHQKLLEEKALLIQENKELLDKNSQLEEQCIKSLEGSVVLSGDEREKEGSDKFELIDIEKDGRSNSVEATRLQTELEEINEKLSILNDIKDQYDLNVVKLGRVVDEKNKLEEELKRYKNENEKLLEEVQVTREAVEKLEDLQKKLDEINLEKEQNEAAVSSLQEDEILLQREFSHMKAEKEKELKELEDVIQSKDEELSALEVANGELRDQLDSVNLEFSKLSIETKEKESKVLSNTSDADCQTDDCVIGRENTIVDAVSFDEIQALISTSVTDTSQFTTESAFSYLKDFVKTTETTYQRLTDREKDLKDLKVQLEKTVREKELLQHEQLTLKADLSYYETEVSELMKNNEILLGELEKLKTGKLETILEHNEDNILRMERQIEDSNKTNHSLQRELKNLQAKLAEAEEEKFELLESKQCLETKLEEQIAKCEALMKVNDEQFRLNQQKTDDSKLEMQQILEEKLSSKNEEVDQLSKQIDSLEADYKLVVDQLEDIRHEKANLLLETEKYRQIIENENEKYEILYQECQELKQVLGNGKTKEDESSQTDCTKDTAGSNAETDELQQTIEKLTKERNELITAVQLKHNENVQYHLKLQELSQALNDVQASVETNKNKPCMECERLVGIIRDADAKIIKLSEQVEFLDEKCERFSESLLAEQKTVKTLNEEKVALDEQKQTIEKDLNRLRGHLIDVENTHTTEIYELQSVIDGFKQEMVAVREEAAKSSNAYTSAR